MILAAAIFTRTNLRADDRPLVESIRGGNLEAFSELYRRHADRVYALLTRIVGPVSEREDWVQEVFVEAYRALPGFRGESTFATFLYRIAVRVGCDGLRRRRRALHLSIEGQAVDDLVSPGASPLDQTAARQELARAFRLLASLSTKQRVAFVLVAIEGLALHEAAELLGAREEAIKQRVIAARKALLHTMAKEHKGERHG